MRDLASSRAAVTRVLVRRTVSHARPLVAPVARSLAWRIRTFLSQPVFDVETRLLARQDGSDGFVSSRLDDVVRRLASQERSISSAARENRKLFGSLRDLLEDQALELDRLRSQITSLQPPRDQNGPRA